MKNNNLKQLKRKLLYGLPELYFMGFLLFLIVVATVGFLMGQYGLMARGFYLIFLVVASGLFALLCYQFRQKKPLLAFWLAFVISTIAFLYMLGMMDGIGRIPSGNIMRSYHIGAIIFAFLNIVVAITMVYLTVRFRRLF